MPLEMGMKSDGTPNIVQQPGPTERIAVGTILDDVRPDELAAFPDRFLLVVDEEPAVPTPEPEPIAMDEMAAVAVSPDAEPSEPSEEGEPDAPRHGRRR